MKFYRSLQRGCNIFFSPFIISNDKEGHHLLSKLSSINKPLEITFKEMIQLMNQCDIVDKQWQHAQLSQTYGGSGGGQLSNADSLSSGTSSSIFPQNPLSLFSGIIPGTKWCGTGDIASTYHELGTETTMDRCCRAHDTCPVKIRAYQRRYKLYNNSLYSK